MGGNRATIPLLFLSVFSVYLLFPSHQHTAFSADANENMYWLERGLFLIDSREVGYRLIGVFFLRLWRWFGYEGAGYAPLQVLSAFFGAGGAAVMRFAISDQAVFGSDFDYDSVSFHCRADAQPHLGLRRHAEGTRIGLYVDNFHSGNCLS